MLPTPAGLLIKTKKLDACLSRLFHSWEHTTCINLGCAIKNFLLFENEDETVRRAGMLTLINTRLPNSLATEINDPQHGFGLRIHLLHDKGSVTIHYLSGFGGQILFMDTSESSLDVSYWL